MCARARGVRRSAFTISFLDCRPSVQKEPFDCDVSVGGGAICRGRGRKRLKPITNERREQRPASQVGREEEEKREQGMLLLPRVIMGTGSFIKKDRAALSDGAGKPGIYRTFPEKNL